MKSSYPFGSCLDLELYDIMTLFVRILNELFMNSLSILIMGNG